MDQTKTGIFMKEFRKEKNITQEELAEVFNVSRRTVSRWETGSNLPDIDILIEMADYYDVDLREILDGERKSERMDPELKETVLKVAEYSSDEKKKMAKIVLVYFCLGIAAMIINIICTFIDLPENFWAGFLKGSTTGLALGAMVLGILYVTGAMFKIREVKMRILRKMIGKE